MPDWKQYVHSRLQTLELSGAREAEIVEEIAQHLEAIYEDARRAGASSEQALGIVENRFKRGPDGSESDFEAVARELGRAAREPRRPPDPGRAAGGRSGVLAGFWQDLRFGTRSFLAKPTFTVVALLTLAIGIGASTVVFSIVDGVLLRSLPYSDPDRLAIIRADVEGLEALASLSAVELQDFRERSTSFQELAGVWSSSVALTDSEIPEQIRYAWATSNLFSMMGTDPILGRHFTAEEEAPNGPPVVILSGELWQRHYGADPDIVGQTIKLDDREREVVGVLPPGFRLLMNTDTAVSSRIEAWVPQTYWVNRNMRWLRIIGKLRPEATFEQAQAEMDAIAENLKAEHAEYAQHPELAFHIVPLHRDLVRDVRPAVLALVGAVGFVLLIVCTNVGNLLLTQTRARRREIAIRVAVGASRPRVIRQVLTESLLLAFAGGFLGLGLAQATVASLPLFAPSNLPRLDAIRVDAGVGAFTFLVSLASCALFGVLPALRATSPRVHDTLKEGGRSGAGAAGRSLRNSLVVAELALSFVLLVGAGLMIQTFLNLGNEDPGFDPENVVTMEVPLSFESFPNLEARWQFFRELTERIESQAGVDRVGAVSLLPLAGGLFTSPFAYDAASEREFGALSADYRTVTPGYFEAMGARLVAGQWFTTAESTSGRRMVIIDENLAKEAWPSRSAIGQRIKVDLAAGVEDSKPEWMDVVGVVQHLRHDQVKADGRPQIYFPLWIERRSDMTLVVRGSRKPELVALSVQQAVKELGSHRPVHTIRTLEEYLEEAMADTRFTVTLMLTFAGIALALAVIGIYGVISSSVSQRTHELGIRMALGASMSDVFRMVLLQAGGLVLLGSALGLAGALVLDRFLETLVFGVATTDLTTFAAGGALLALASLAACLRPAWRGARVDLVTALRHG